VTDPLSAAQAAMARWVGARIAAGVDTALRQRQLKQGRPAPDQQAELAAVIRAAVDQTAAELFPGQDRLQGNFRKTLLKGKPQDWPLVNGTDLDDVVSDVHSWILDNDPRPGGGKDTVAPSSHPYLPVLCRCIITQFGLRAENNGVKNVILYPRWNRFWTTELFTSQNSPPASLPPALACGNDFHSPVGAGGKGNAATSSAYLLDPAAQTVAELFDPQLVPNPLTDLAGRSMFKVLHHRSQVVPFIDAGSHDQLREAIIEWAGNAESEPDVKVKIVTGAAGTGKSRLAAQVCADLTDPGALWQAGFADPNRAQKIQPSAPPLFAVFDYAEHAPDLIGTLIGRLQRHQDRRDLQAPVRILLLARGIGPWWEDRLLSHVEDTALLGGEVVKIAGRKFGRAARRIHARAAFEAFTTGYGQSGVYPAELDAYAEALDRPLTVHIAALLAAQGDRSFINRPGLVNETDLLKELLRRESRRWRRYGRITGDDNSPDFMTFEAGKEALAIATLVGPTLRHFPELLTAAPTFSETDSERRAAIAEALYDRYPGPECMISPDSPAEVHVAPVEPDLLAAYLLSSTRNRTHIITSLVDHPILAEHHPYYARLLNALALAADSYGAIATDLATHLSKSLSALIGAPERSGHELAQLLSRRLPTLVTAAVARARDQDLSAAQQLTLALSLSNPQGNTAIDQAAAEVTKAHLLPYPHAGLTELGITLAARALAYHQRISNHPELAAAHSTLAAWLGAGGRHTEAVIHSESAVSYFKRLGDASSADFAAALNILAGDLSQAGRPDEALAVAERAVECYMEVAHEDLNYQLFLAMALHNLVGRLDEAGRLNDALVYAQKAVECFEEIAQREGFCLPDHVSVVCKLASLLAKVGRRDEALAHTVWAAEWGEKWAKADRAAYLPILALSTHNLASRLAEVGRLEEAFIAGERSVQFFEEVVRQNRTGHLQYLARSLALVTWILEKQGTNLSAAIAYCDRSIECFRKLTEDEPAIFESDLAFMEDVRRSLTSVILLLALGDYSCRYFEVESWCGRCCASMHSTAASARGPCVLL
jgi:tetratricopeptide (TPR) repeat protein